MTIKTNKEWEKDFDKKWNFWHGTTEQKNAIKFFIHSLHSSECRRLRKEIEGMKYPEEKGQNSSGEFSKFPKADSSKPEQALTQYIYNQALSDILKLLEE